MLDTGLLDERQDFSGRDFIKQANSKGLQKSSGYLWISKTVFPHGFPLTPMLIVHTSVSQET